MTSSNTFSITISPLNEKVVIPPSTEYSTFITTALRGYTGSQGATGFAGSIGITGYTGSVGATGFDGSIGSTGFVGSIGSIGYTGSIGAVGFNGSIGAVGATGFVGSIGATGFNGSTGFIGSIGATGFNGSIGAVGFNGSIGATGFNGSIGFTGSIGAVGFVGSIGATGFNGSTGFTGSQGAIGFTGSQGSVGFTGSQGAQGVTGFNGSQGTQGSVGFTGSAGFVGSIGAIGFTGSQGSQGSTGFNGSVGFTGSIGAIGYTGSASPIHVDTIDPTALNDVNSGYVVGSRWLNSNTATTWVCFSSTASNAVWRKQTPSTFRTFVSGRWYNPWGPHFTTATGSNLDTSISLMPFEIVEQMTISSLGLSVVTAGGNTMVAIYASDPATVKATGTPLCNVEIITTSTGFASTNLATPLTLPPGLYWGAYEADNATVRCSAGSGLGPYQSALYGCGGADQGTFTTAYLYTSAGRITRANTYGSWPDLTGLTLNGNGSLGAMIFLKAN